MNKWILTLTAIATFGCQQFPISSTDSSADSQLITQAKKYDIAFIEQVEAQPGKTVIPYKKYQLNNGLTLILHQDASDPLVHVDVTYHVGSAREELGKSGFAHFFEHMMFQGSEHIADEQHFKIVTESGGTMNGTTNTDRTNYYQTVPANQLEKILWLESDRMGYLLDAVTQEKFEVQRETVKNERGQRIDNRPYGRLNERVSQAVYPAGHPYSWPVIGYMEDLNRVNVNDLKAFFLRWYGPNNATLTIGGDIDVEQTLALVNKYFSDIPVGPEVKKPEKPLITLAKDRYISMEDNVHLPLLYMSIPTVNIRHEDEAPLDLLSTILGGGKTSLLYKNLVKDQIAVQASVSHPCGELGCTFNLYALPHPTSGKSLADIEHIIRQTLDEFELRGVEQDDLIKAKAAMETGFVFGLQSVAGKVSQLAANQTFTDNPNYIEQDIARYANVTKEDVIRVYNRYIKNKHAVIMSVVPKGQKHMIAAPDNFTPTVVTADKDSDTKIGDLAMRTSPKTFDRSKTPKAGANKAVSLPKTWRQQLKNGVTILGTQSTETPTTSMLIKIPTGHYYEQKNKAGITTLLTDMLNESTNIRSGEEMSKALQKLGSSVSISAGSKYVSVSINTLTKNLAETLVLVNEKLTQPAFKQNEFDRIKSTAIQAVINNKKDAGYLAARAFKALVNDDSILATPRAGSVKSLKNIQLADVRSYYQQQFKPDGGQIITVTDLTQQAIVKQLKSFEAWQGQGKPLTLTAGKSKAKAGTIYLVNKDKAAQSAIRIGKQAMTEDITGDYYKAFLMNFPLGDAFNSRINLNLREDKGYTYGASSYFSANKVVGTFNATAEVRANVTDKSIIEMVNEIKQYQKQGITAEELEFMRNAINQKDALKYETPHAKLGFLSKILEHNLTPDFVDERAKIVDTISQQELNTIAKQQLNINDMFMVVVGDAKILKPQLKALGYPVIEYTLQ